MAGRFSVEAVFKAIDRVTAPVSRMQNRVGKFTRGMERGLRAANRVLDRTVLGFRRGAGVIAKVGAAGIGLVAGAVGLLVREFSKVENAEAAFTPLLGGAEAARRAVQAINDTAATTPFQFETLASSVNQLLPVMQGGIDGVIKTVRMLGDTAGGNAEKLSTITRGFTKAMLKGKVDMESLNMVAEAGVPIFSEMQKMLGVTGERFFKMVSAGKIGTKELTRAFERMTSAGGIFHKGMEIASQTTTGLWSTFKDNISLTAAELGGVLAPTVKELIRQATAAAQRVRAWVSANRELIQDRVDKFVASATESIKKFIARLQSLNAEHDMLATAAQLLKRMGRAAEFLAKHGATIAKAIGYVIAMSLAMKALAAVVWLVNVALMANPIGLIVTAVGLAVIALASLWTWADEIAEKFDGMPGVLKAAFAPIYALVKTVQWLKNNLGSIVSGAKSVGSFLGFGSDDEAEAVQAGGAGSIVSPQDRMARSVEEHRSTSSAEVTIRDETRRAEVTKGKLGHGLFLEQTGGF